MNSESRNVCCGPQSQRKGLPSSPTWDPAKMALWGPVVWAALRGKTWLGDHQTHRGKYPHFVGIILGKMGKPWGQAAVRGGKQQSSERTGAGVRDPAAHTASCVCTHIFVGF